MSQQIQVFDPSDFNSGKPVSTTNPLPVQMVGGGGGGGGANPAQDGTDSNTVSVPAGSGAVGIRGWLSLSYGQLVAMLAQLVLIVTALTGVLKTQRVDARATGTIAANTANATYVVALSGGMGVIGYTISGLTGTGATLVVEASNNGGTSYQAINAVVPVSGVPSQFITADGNYRVNAGGHTNVQLRVSTAGTAATITVTSNASAVGSLVGIAAPVSIGAGQTIGAPLAAPITGQIKIATTGTAVALPSNALLNGLVVKAKNTNAAQSATYSGMVGPSGVTTLYDGTGTGYPLAPGEASSFAVANSNQIYVNGTAGDVFTFAGN